MLHIVYDLIHDANPMDHSASSPSQKSPLPPLFFHIPPSCCVCVCHLFLALFGFPLLSAVEVNLLYDYLSRISQDDDGLYPNYLL